MNEACVSLTFDDGLRCQFEQAVPILNQHGLPATFFLLANERPFHEQLDWSKITWSDEDIRLLRRMIQQGHEIGSHSVTHTPASQYRDPDHDAKIEAETSKQWIESRLGTKVLSYCYPFCDVSKSMKSALMNAGYKQARAGTREGSFVCNLREADIFQLDSREISRCEDVVSWVRPGCWRILMYHGIGTDGYAPISVSECSRQMAELAKLRDAGKVNVITFKDGGERLRNPALTT
jgi:peptidoglycan/xylan/chitin deacetylase (PgdA/CDA1 family)